MGQGDAPKERGTYQRELIADAPADWAVGTEVEQTTVATKLVASGQDERVLWARFSVYVYDASVPTITEWMLLKCLATDAIQDMNDSSAIELLLKRGKILKRGYHHANANLAYGSASKVKWEIFNVDLNDGEELRMLFRPVLNAGTATSVVGELEYRLAGQ